MGRPSPTWKGQAVAPFGPLRARTLPPNPALTSLPASRRRLGTRAHPQERIVGCAAPGSHHAESLPRGPSLPGIATGEPRVASALTFGRSSPDLRRCGASTRQGAETQLAETPVGAGRTPLSSRRPNPAPLLPPPADWCHPLSAPGHLWVGLGERGARGWRPQLSPCGSPRTPG